MRSKILHKTIALLVVAMFLSSPGLNIVSIVSAASLEDQLDKVEKEIKQIRNQRSSLESQKRAQQNKLGGYYSEVDRLRDEVEGLQLSIAELDLQIKELEINIQLLEKEIGEKEESITENEEDLGTLEDETTSLLLSSYMDFRVRGRNRVDIFNASDANDYFKDSQYKQVIQKVTNKGMKEVIELKQQLEYDKQLLEEKSVDLNRNKAIVDEQQKQVTKLQKGLESEIAKYQSAIYSTKQQVAGIQNTIGRISEQEAKKEAEAERLRQEIFNKFNSIPSGRYVTKGTMIGRQGKTGKATGPHVHFMVKRNGADQNPCNYVPKGRFSNCGGNGSLDYPLRGTFYYTSPYGYRCISGWGYCSFHRAIDIAHSVWNAPVYATHSGWLYKGVDSYGALYVILCENKNCNSGFKTGYWHLSAY